MQTTAVVVCCAVVSSACVRHGLRSPWYGLVRPAWTPPPVVFAATWSVLYGLIAHSMMHTSQPHLHRLHLCVGVLWCYQFFVLHDACATVLTSTVVLLTAVGLFLGHERVRWTLLPLVVWCGFALSLNVASCRAWLQRC